VITHGTDTMVDTAAALARAVPGKTIVPHGRDDSVRVRFLGRIVQPWQRAVARAGAVPGIYIAMNGRHFEWNKVRKNRETGVFEATA